MIEITKEHINSNVKGYSVRLPSEFHNVIKAQAALEGKTKDQLVLELLALGAKVYKSTK